MTVVCSGEKRTLRIHREQCRQKGALAQAPGRGRGSERLTCRGRCGSRARAAASRRTRTWSLCPSCRPRAPPRASQPPLAVCARRRSMFNIRCQKMNGFGSHVQCGVQVEWILGDGKKRSNAYAEDGLRGEALEEGAHLMHARRRARLSLFALRELDRRRIRLQPVQSFDGFLSLRQDAKTQWRIVRELDVRSEIKAQVKTINELR